MSIETQLVEIAENMPKVYNAGFEKGKAEGGINYDAFWDAFQNNGKATSYHYAFSYNRFNMETFNPKYAIVGTSTGTSLQNVFYNNNVLTEINVDIDARSSSHIGGMFYGCINLKTIKKLFVDGTTTGGGNNAFNKCSALTSIEIGGTIVMSWDMSFCPLDKDSILSVFNALSTSATGKTCTFNKAAVNAVFTDEEWKALTDTKTNWTITLA